MNYIRKTCIAIIFLVILSGSYSCMQKPAHNTSNTQPLNGEKTAELISKFYQDLGPKLGSHLVEPNVVLTLSGLRGMGHFLTYNLTEDEKNKIERLNEKSKPEGIYFFLYDDKKDGLADITIYNFKGVEHTSKLSKLPFILPFNAASGFEGFTKWLDTIATKAKNYFKQSQDQNTLETLPFDHLLLGIELGYPDQALLDAFYAIRNDTKFSNLASSKIPYSDYYPNPQPNFRYFSQHEEESSIVQTRNAWGELLKEFYNSEWHTLISENPEFINMVKSEEELHDTWIKKKFIK